MILVRVDAGPSGKAACHQGDGSAPRRLANIPTPSGSAQSGSSSANPSRFRTSFPALMGSVTIQLKGKGLEDRLLALDEAHASKKPGIESGSPICPTGAGCRPGIPWLGRSDCRQSHPLTRAHKSGSCPPTPNASSSPQDARLPANRFRNGG